MKNLFDSYEQFERHFRGYAESIARKQGVRNSLLTLDERVNEALENVFLKARETYDPSRGAQINTYVFTLLHNDLYTRRDYDRMEVQEEDTEHIIGCARPHVYNLSGEEMNEDEDLMGADEEICSQDDLSQLVRESDERECLPDESAGLDHYDARMCVRKSLVLAVSEFSKDERLILTRDEAQHRDDSSIVWSNSDGRYVCVGSDGSKLRSSLHGKQIAELLDISEANVRYKRCKLQEPLRQKMERHFSRLYHGSDGPEAFRREYDRLKC